MNANADGFLSNNVIYETGDLCLVTYICYIITPQSTHLENKFETFSPVNLCLLNLIVVQLEELRRWEEESYIFLGPAPPQFSQKEKKKRTSKKSMSVSKYPLQWTRRIAELLWEYVTRSSPGKNNQ